MLGFKTRRHRAESRGEQLCAHKRRKRKAWVNAGGQASPERPVRRSLFRSKYRNTARIRKVQSILPCQEVGE